MQTTSTHPAASRPYLALGLTFLLLGIGYANPWPLVSAPPNGMWEGSFAPEVLNLYALAVSLGWAHFFYAWQGQWKGSTRMSATHRTLYWLAIAVILVAFVSVRSWLGVGLFSLIVWVYNIAHFIKAETYFAGQGRSKGYYAPAIAFTWFTLTLFQAGPLHNARLVFAGSVVLGALSLVTGDWRHLARGNFQLPLLTLFLIGETLVWSAYSPYMSAGFRVGVYVFHVAAASFFHYLSSYFFAKTRQPANTLTSPAAIVAINILCVAAIYAVLHIAAMNPATYIFGPAWFKLWVALHLAASDLLPWWKQRTTIAVPAMS